MVVWRGSPVAAPVGQNLPQVAPSNVPASNQTYVRGLPVPSFPLRPFTANVVPGTDTGVPGKPIALASGNPAVSTDPSVAPPENPKGYPRILGVGQESSWRGPVFGANEKLTVRDRHVMSKVGTELSGRDSGFTDPPMDGPARPSYQTINRTINYQAGSDATRNQDDLSRPYARNAQGMFMGEQGSGWIKVNGGVPGLWQPYGSYAGYTAGPVKGIQSPVEQGSAGDGNRSLFSGPPHGLHSATMPDYTPTLGYYMAVPQMRLPRQDRPSNSTAGGQSYSQTVVPQGQTGTAVQQPTSGLGGGVNWKATQVSGWRGQAGAGNAI